MTDPQYRLADAEAQAVQARERLSSTLAELQARLQPRRLARRAVSEAAEAGENAVTAIADGARRHPAALAGVSALAGLFFARHRIADLAGSLRRSVSKRKRP